MARYYRLRLNDDGDSLESSFHFRPGALKMRRLAELLTIVHEESMGFRIYPIRASAYGYSRYASRTIAGISPP